MSPTRARSRSLLALAATVLLAPAAVAVVTAAPATAAPGPNLAAGRTAAASATGGASSTAALTDGNQATYWQGSGAFPQWAQVDLGGTKRVDRVQLKVPAGWAPRTQTLSVQGSPDGAAFATIVTSAAYTFAPGSGNTVTIDFGATTARYVRVEVTGNTGAPAAQLSSVDVFAAAAVGPNLAAGRAIQVSSSQGGYPGGNANDANQGSYWESANHALPQWIQVDLGSAVSVNQLVLKLPTGWETRTQTLTVQSSTNGSSFGTLVASAGYVFDPSSGNTVTVDFAAATTRYVRLNITGNTGWPAGQLSELEVYGPATGDTQAPSAPANLAYTQPATGQIRLTWNASTDNVGVTGYDIYANNTLRTSVAGNVTSYTDSQPDGTTVSYRVRAKDAAGNQSGDSNTVTRPGTPTGGTNLAAGKPITASGHVHTFVATNANDNNVGTYWESNGFPGTLTVRLGSNASINSVVVRLNPDPVWGTRQQTLQVLGREQSAAGFGNLVAQQAYTFNPASSNTVTIPVSATVADVQLRFTANTGAPGGQVAELQVIGSPAPNPDLTVTGITSSPAAPVETSAITLSATVRNGGSAASAATDVNFYLGTTLVGTAAVGALAAGAATTVSANIGPRTAGTYQVTAKVDEDDDVIEQNDANNSFTSPTSLVVTAVSSSDLVAEAVGWTPSNPANGSTVTFSAAIRNQGNIASASGAHGVTLTLLDDAGAVVRTLTGSYSGTIAAGGSSPVLNLGTWTAANGRYTVRVVLANDGNELPVKQANNTSERPLFVGRGANMPFDILEAEDGAVGGGASLIGPNRTVGDLAGEASGRRAVTLNQNGAYVQFTTRNSTNTLVTRFSIPDSAGGGGTSSTLNVYVDDVFHKAIPLTSKYAWLYGAESGPGNSPGAGSPRHIYDEANIFLNSTVPAGSRIKLQKDAANSGTFAIDFISTEQVSQVGNPDPARYTTPAGFSHQDVQNALDRVRMDTTGNLVGVYLPAGEYPTTSKFQVYGKAVRVVGAGAWYTRFVAPQNQSNTDVGFRVEGAASGSLFTGFSYFGNYTERIDGPGKVFDLQHVSAITIDGIWTEHQMCLFWGLDTDNMIIRNNRIRDGFADAINMTNGSSGNLVSNNESRSSGDDSFALFAATDGGGGAQRDNVFENLTSILTWRAAGVAVYGGLANTFRNIYVADTLVYSGITISSLDFGYPMDGFGANPPTVFDGLSIVRAGGHFWGAQTFPGIWVYSASKVFQGIRVSNVDIVDPTYHGIMFQTDYKDGVALFPVADTVFTNVSISGARRSGDAYDARSGFGIWANELPEPGEGPVRGSVTFNNLRFSNNFQNIRNTTTTFTININ